MMPSIPPDIIPDAFRSPVNREPKRVRDQVRSLKQSVISRRNQSSMNVRSFPRPNQPFAFKFTPQTLGDIIAPKTGQRLIYPSNSTAPHAPPNSPEGSMASADTDALLLAVRSRLWGCEVLNQRDVDRSEQFFSAANNPKIFSQPLFEDRVYIIPETYLVGFGYRAATQPAMQYKLRQKDRTNYCNS